jgi:hypothetical protein
MECTLVIDAKLLKAPLGYKYVIYSPKVTKEHEYYEKLHPFVKWNNDPNRCLFLSGEDLAYGGIQRYDFIVYPPEMKVPKSLYDQLRDTRFAKFLFGRRTQTENAADVEMKIPSKYSMIVKSLNFYLEPYMAKLLSNAVGSFSDIWSITSVFFQHCELWFKDCYNHYCDSLNLDKEMKTWLEEATVGVASAEQTLHHFASAMLIVCCVQECHISQSLKIKDFVIPLLRMLSLQYDIKQRVAYLMDDIPQNSRVTVALAVSRLFKEITHSSAGVQAMDWLCVVPLYNFMIGNSEPYMKAERHPSRICMNARADGNLNLTLMKRRIPSGFVNEHYSFLEPLFALDPLLLHQLVFLCHPGDYTTLFKMIPSYLSFTWLVSLAADSEPWKICRENGKDWLQWLKTVNLKIKEELTEECTTSFDGALILVMSLFRKQTNIHHYIHYLDVLKMAIRALLISLGKVKPLVIQKKLEESKIFEVFGRCQQSLHDWIVRRDVIGGSSFGGGGAKKGPQEIKLWEALLSVTTPNEDGIIERWNTVVTAVVKKRVNAAPVNMMLSLVPLIKDDMHPILSSALMDGSIQAIDKICSEVRRLLYALMHTCYIGA